MKILHIEDDTVFQMYFKRSCKKAGIDCDIETAADGEKALEALLNYFGETGEDPPEVVILDLNLPRLRGHEIIEEAHKQGVTVIDKARVIVVTGSAATEDEKRVRELGLVEYFSKDNIDGLMKELKNHKK